MSTKKMLDTENHIDSLDGLRALAIIAVMGFHGNWSGFSGGGFGVDLFFALSGFLITWLLLKEFQRFGRISIKLFYIRRALRIIPAYILFLLGYVILVLIIFQDLAPRLVSSTLVAATYTTNIALSWFDWPALQVHTWTLSLEEQFYLIFPAIVAWLPRRKALYLIFAMLVIAPIWRSIVYFITEPSNTYRIGMGPDTRFDSILWGSLLAYIYINPLLRKRFGSNFGASILISGFTIVILSIIFIMNNNIFRNTIGYSVISIGFCFILWYVINNSEGWLIKILTWKPLVFIGTLSYSLYLWHMPMVGLTSRVRLRLDSNYSEIGSQIFYVVASIVAASISYYAVERPFFKLKRKYTLITN